MLAKAAALIILLAAPSTLAQPAKTESVERVRYDNKRPPPRAHARPDGEVELASPTPARHGTEYIVVDKELGPFSKLRVDASGRVVVRRVKIYFADGTRRVINVDKILSPARASTEIDLKRDAAIDQIVIDTEPTRGSYSVHGLTASGGVAKR